MQEICINCLHCSSSPVKDNCFSLYKCYKMNPETDPLFWALHEGSRNFIRLTQKCENGQFEFVKRSIIEKNIMLLLEDGLGISFFSRLKKL